MKRNRYSNLRRVGVAALALAALTPASARAQPMPTDEIDQTQHLAQINEQTIVPALSVVTGNHLNGVSPDGGAMLIATATNGLKFEVSLRACTDANDSDGNASAEASEPAAEPRHCRGIMILSAWDPAPEKKMDSLGQAVDQFLIENPAVNAGKTGDGSPYVARYVIVDYGAPQGNLISEFANFIRSATAFQNAIAPLYSD